MGDASVAGVPVVDFGRFLHGAEDERKSVAKQIDEAFRDVGFVYLVNHGVPQEKVDECFAWSKKFFDLPKEKKMLAPHPPGGAHHRGYSAPGVEKITQHVYDGEDLKKEREIPDYKESFESGNTTDASQPNIWPPPSIIPGFQPFLESYFTHCQSLIHSLLAALSLSLSIPSPGLPPTHVQSLFQLRLLHYPPIAASQLSAGKRSRINAHSDFGTLTLLWQDGVGGLEVQDPRQEGRWRNVGQVDGGVLVNVGDLMSRWSNGRWRSTVHRVGLPPLMSSPETIKIPGPGVDTEGRRGEKEIVLDGGDEVMVPERYSIPFFATADPDTVIEALPGCWSEENPKMYEPVTAWGYVQMRMAALYEG